MLLLARDRLGERPLFYTWHGETIYFGSEIKAIFNGAPVGAQIDRTSLCDVFTYWSTLPGRTMFRGISEIPPGHYLAVGAGGAGSARIFRYWEPAEAKLPSGIGGALDIDSSIEQLEHLLADSTRLRLRADVPVAAYLSGGLDSSLIASLACAQSSGQLQTFSVAFTDTDFDERVQQEEVASHLGVRHHVLEVTHAQIGEAFPEVIWHAEVPTLRTAPAPMFLLSKQVCKAGIKVVLTGEGADEVFLGYDIFKEAKVRSYWAREPDSQRRPGLLCRLYPEIFQNSVGSKAFVKAFFGSHLTETAAPFYSHALRWQTTRRSHRFLGEDVIASQTQSASLADAFGLPSHFASLTSVERAQCLEMQVFLPQYLLSTQGDRMAMAHSVEGRYPFLDGHIVAFANQLPPRFKLRGLRDKWLLRKVAQLHLPESVSARRKRPYRAPIHRSFFPPGGLDYVEDILDRPALQRSGLFRPEVVAQLRAKLMRGQGLGETDDMALCGIISTQLLHHHFVEKFCAAKPAVPAGRETIVRRNSEAKVRS